MTTHELNSYKVLIEIMAHNEEDMREQLDSLDSYELEWWTECNIKKKCLKCGANLVNEENNSIQGEVFYYCPECKTMNKNIELDEEEVIEIEDEERKE